MRLIDADAIPYVDLNSDMPQSKIRVYVAFKERIDRLPTIDPVKHGEWEMKPDPFGFFDDIPVCSECGCTTKMREKYNYCPNCGARMERSEE